MFSRVLDKIRALALIDRMRRSLEAQGHGPDKVQTRVSRTLERVERELRRMQPKTWELIERNEYWQRLLISKKFEEEKALASLQTSDNYLRSIAPAGPVQAIKSKAPSLATLRKYRGEDVQHKTVEALLLLIMAMLSERKRMNRNQITQLARWIVEDYHFLNLAEIKLCLTGGIKGKYGKVFGALDAMVVLEWFELYEQERLGEVESAWAKYSHNVRHQQPAPEVAERMADSLQRIASLSDEQIEREGKAGPASRGSFQYQSIGDFLRFEKGMGDAQIKQYLEAFQAGCEADFRKERPEMNESDYLTFRYNLHLAELNKGIEDGNSN